MTTAFPASRINTLARVIQKERCLAIYGFIPELILCFIFKKLLYFHFNMHHRIQNIQYSQNEVLFSS